MQFLTGNPNLRSKDANFESQEGKIGKTNLLFEFDWPVNKEKVLRDIETLPAAPRVCAGPRDM